MFIDDLIPKIQIDSVAIIVKDLFEDYWRIALTFYIKIYYYLYLT